MIRLNQREEGTYSEENIDADEDEFCRLERYLVEKLKLERADGEMMTDRDVPGQPPHQESQRRRERTVLPGQ